MNISIWNKALNFANNLKTELESATSNAAKWEIINAAEALVRHNGFGIVLCGLIDMYKELHNITDPNIAGIPTTSN